MMDTCPQAKRPASDGMGVPTLIRDEPVGRIPRRSKALRRGTRIGRYIVQRVLGRGGMGVVYGAVDPQLGRRVALKLVRCDSLRFRGRLRREALALARLCHPNIVVLFDIGTTDLGTFVAMEYVRGQSLRRWLRKTPRSTAEILRTFIAAGRGLAAAHAEGLVHRDVKPGNVMVALDGRVKVLDFGLARGEPSDDPWLANTDEALLARRMTRADTVVGTTGYMPPEQLLGREVTAASDQFAFCVALFEALHGGRPFAGKTMLEQARAYAVGTRNPIKLRRGVPMRVRMAIERGMSLDPTDRFTSMDALLEALAPRPSRWRSRALVGAGLILATAAASAATARWLHLDRAQACMRAPSTPGR